MPQLPCASYKDEHSLPLLPCASYQDEHSLPLLPVMSTNLCLCSRPAPRPAHVVSQISLEACWSAGLDEAFKANLDISNVDASSLKWQYMGTPSGLWRQFPGKLPGHPSLMRTGPYDYVDTGSHPAIKLSSSVCAWLAFAPAPCRHPPENMRCLRPAPQAVSALLLARATVQLAVFFHGAEATLGAARQAVLPGCFASTFSLRLATCPSLSGGMSRQPLARVTLSLCWTLAAQWTKLGASL